MHKLITCFINWSQTAAYKILIWKIYMYTICLLFSYFKSFHVSKTKSQLSFLHT